MSLSLAGTTLNDLFADSLPRLMKPWSPDGTEPKKDVTLFAQQLVKVLSSEVAVPVTITTTTTYDLFRSQLVYLRDRVWDLSPDGLQAFSEALVAVFSSSIPIGIDASSTSLYQLFRKGIARLRSRRWSAEVQPFADEVVNVLASTVPITILERTASANDAVTVSESVSAVRT